MEIKNPDPVTQRLNVLVKKNCGKLKDNFSRGYLITNERNIFLIYFSTLFLWFPLLTLYSSCIQHLCILCKSITELLKAVSSQTVYLDR